MENTFMYIHIHLKLIFCKLDSYIQFAFSSDMGREMHSLALQSLNQTFEVAQNMRKFDDHTCMNGDVINQLMKLIFIYPSPLCIPNILAKVSNRC